MTEGGAPAGGLFDGVLARGDVRSAVSDRAWLQAMLDFEAALARSQARAGLLPTEDAAAIGRACRAEAFDVGELSRSASDGGNPAAPLVRALMAAVGSPASAHVHRGATSQDVLDTAAMLVAKRALAPLLSDTAAAADSAARLAGEHRATLMAGRTLLQQALPITFGWKAATWLAGLDDAAARLVAVRRDRLAVQLGGAAGTLASLGEAGPSVVAFLAEELGLAAPLAPWHTTRNRIAELACALGEAAGALGKPARDVILLAQSEVSEVHEGGAASGGSSALPQKHNPVAAIAAVASAMRTPGLVATILSCMLQEHERAAGAWHAEWLPLRDVLLATGSTAAWLRECLEHLQVDPRRMRENLDRARGMVLAERVASSLAPALGRLAAQELVRSACAEAVATGHALGDGLRAHEQVRAALAPAELDALLDPSTYLGTTQVFIDRVLGAHARKA